MNFVLLIKKNPWMKLMCKIEIFQRLETKNELFKIQGQKPNFMQNLQMNTII